ncbi:MAG: GNAT family N-acetyltransferase [Geminicoccaceae bacterium]
MTEIRSADALRPWYAEWDRLASISVTANPFYERGALVPAIEEGVVDDGWCILLIRDGDDPSRLIGLLPIERKRFHMLIPQRIWRALTHVYAFSTVPLLDRDRLHIAIDALLHWVGRDGVPALDLVDIPVEEPIHKALRARLVALYMPRFMHNPRDRAALHPGQSTETYLAGALRKKRRKELARQYRRLGEHGRLECRRLEAGASIDPWIEQFLALEAMGWKGRSGTAIGASSAHRRHFERLVADFHARGHIDICGLFLDDQPVALKCNLVGACDDRAGFAFKIAYDESFERYSPGVQLEIEQIAHMHGDQAKASWMDSCASSQHFMIDRLWTERRRFASLLVGPPTIRGRSMIKALEGAAALHRIYGG